VYVADHVLRAVAVPAGEHSLEMRYESAALSVGLVISLAAAAVLLGLAIESARTGRILVRATA
jgi:hypothetical protein